MIPHKQMFRHNPAEGSFGDCSDANCGDVSGYLCDFPVSNGKTCDSPLCGSHAFEVAPNIHYCPGHTLMWREFRESGGVTRELTNVVPYKQTPKGSKP